MEYSPPCLEQINEGHIQKTCRDWNYETLITKD